MHPKPLPRNCPAGLPLCVRAGSTPSSTPNPSRQQYTAPTCRALADEHVEAEGQRQRGSQQSQAQPHVAQQAADRQGIAAEGRLQRKKAGTQRRGRIGSLGAEGRSGGVAGKARGRAAGPAAAVATAERHQHCGRSRCAAAPSRPAPAARRRPVNRTGRQQPAAAASRRLPHQHRAAAIQVAHGQAVEGCGDQPAPAAHQQRADVHLRVRQRLCSRGQEVHEAVYEAMIGEAKGSTRGGGGGRGGRRAQRQVGREAEKAATPPRGPTLPSSAP